jgi:regulator of protease activity HflC (stomatin/prohibitin superfamily)
MVELILGAAAVFAGISLLTGVRMLQEYERAVIFRLGRARKELASPGLNFLLPWGIDRVRVVDIRTKAIQISPQEVITHDNISISVDAVVYASVASPSHAVLEVEQFMPATLQLAATTLRAVLGKMDLDEILAHRDRINNEIRTILDTRTEQWGVEISAVEIKDIQLPKEMQRAMARQAEAERERRAKVIAAEGEVQAASKLVEAAAMIAVHPGALQLRLYQTLVEVAAQASSTIVFPVPIDLTSGLSGAAGSGSSPQQLQNMMQSAVALAASEKARQLAASSREDELPGVARAPKRQLSEGPSRGQSENPSDAPSDESSSSDDQLVPAPRR